MKQTSSHPFSWWRAALLGGTALSVVTALAFTPRAHANDNSQAAPVRLEVNDSPVARNGKFTTSFAPMVKKVSPSVVKVSVTAKLTPTALSGPDTPDLHRFFGEGENSQDSPRQFRAPKQHGVGSGVIVTKDGYILTNNHVVEGADDIKVALDDGSEFSARVIGRDPQTDIAVLKIDARGLPFLTLADSDKIEVGDVVLAVGNPFGIGQTVTSGIISAKGRATLGLDYEDFIQTDAAINPGNSGGALVDTDGRLIGINTAILSHSGGNQGIGFAVPTNLARWVMESLVKNGRVERGFLGVNIQDLTPRLAKEFRLDHDNGALVSEVTPQSPADKAGLKNGDVIVEFNGKPVTDSRHLKLQVGATLPGSSLPIKIIRDGDRKTLQVTVRALPGEMLAKISSTTEKAKDALHGVVVAELDRASRAELNVPERVNGALISQVEPDSAAYEAGLRGGDVITEINRRPVKNAEQAVAACEKPADKQTLVKVWSHGGSRYVVVDETKAG
ncbi:MAG: DegQ family serine endoprotease [Limisphaerales bacterium]